MTIDLKVISADYRNPDHAKAIVYLLDRYARDPMGGGQPLPRQVLDNLVPELAQRPYAFSLLAYIRDQAGDKAVGLLNGFEGFSTFACKPLLNIHDVTVLPEYRGRGIAQHLLAATEALARDRGCCKLTLEVLSENSIARAAYRRFGFRAYSLSSDTGEAGFWQKPLD